jgi:hypothetical protein
MKVSAVTLALILALIGVSVLLEKLGLFAADNLRYLPPAIALIVAVAAIYSVVRRRGNGTSGE